MHLICMHCTTAINFRQSSKVDRCIHELICIQTRMKYVLVHKMINQKSGNYCVCILASQ